MDDLIIRKALMKYMRDYKWEFALNSDFSKAIEMVDVQPAVEAVPVVHGEWKTDCGVLFPVYRCSECNCATALGKTKFCPNCGADMRTSAE